MKNELDYIRIDTLEQYISGFSKYCRDIGGYILNMEGFSGRFLAEGAKGVIRQQIDKGLPIPYLLLYHKNPSFKDLELWDTGRSKKGGMVLLSV